MSKRKSCSRRATSCAGRAAQAVQAGAFGGSRAAVQEGMAQEALGRQLAEIQASGQQQAFEQAQQQFERDRAARESAERLGLGAAEMAGSQASNLAALGKLAREGDVRQRPCLRKWAVTFSVKTKLDWILPMKILFVSGLPPRTATVPVIHS